MAQAIDGPGIEPIEVVPVVVLSQVFPARPSSIPDIRNFVRHCLAESPLTEEGTKQVGETVFRALLDAAGPTGSIHVAFRIFPEHVEVDVLHSESRPPLATAPTDEGNGWSAGSSGQPVGGVGAGHGAAAGHGAVLAHSPMLERAEAAGGDGVGAAGPGAALSPAVPVQLGGPGQPATFAEWMSTALRREGLTQEAAARQLGVSVKTISRWVGGTTEPRMRDLRRIQEVFGELPLP
ncbi:MAG TPA: helix-turn-helix transcriptional regulator [Streptosporangiaceae bacterium]|nr:helix-turn-helix transcriptional regulator [Streptosporangiaceae bacterium]